MIVKDFPWILSGAVAMGLAVGALFAWFFFPQRTGKKAVDRTAAEQVDYMRSLLAFLLVGAFVGYIPLFIFKVLPTENKEIVVYMVGQLSGMALTALGFYFVNKAGQDALDNKKADNTGKALEAITETAKAAQVAGTGDGGGSLDEEAIQDGDQVTVSKTGEDKK